MERVVDLTLRLAGGMPVYPGDPAVSVEWACTLERDGFNLSRLGLGAHAGTHVDLPRHFAAAGTDAARMDLERFFGPAVALELPKGPGGVVSAEELRGQDIRPGDIVLLRTGWEARAGTAAFFEAPWPGLAPDAGEYLIGLGVKAVGGDFPSVESPEAVAAGAPVHRALAEAGVPVFECLVNLGEVAGKRFWFCGLPLKIAGGEASPVRAMGILLAEFKGGEDRNQKTGVSS